MTGRVLPTLEDVAREAGVSRSTASRVVNGGARVSPETLTAVDRAIERLGYVPNRAARSLVTNRSDSVALVVPEPDETVLSDPFFARVLRGITEILDEVDLQLVLVMARPGKVARAERFLRARHTDGVIVVSHHRDDRIEAAVVATRAPVVLIGRPFSGDVPWVDGANREGGRLAAEHLIERGARRVAVLAGPQDMAAGLDRLAGARDALAAAGLREGPVVETPFTRAGGAAAMDRVLAEDPEVDGVVAASDMVAAGALRTLTAHGRRVPEDVRLVGYDDLGLADELHLTTVANPAEEMGRTAARALLRWIAGRPATGPVELPVRIVVREST